MYTEDNATVGATITQPQLALGYCLLAVLGFSLTLPATRVASGELDPLILGPGRGAIAGAGAIAWLCMRRERLPSPRQLRSIALVALGTVIGFPLLTALALRSVPTYRAVLVVGLAPLSTSLFAALRNKERLSLGFWLSALLGGGAVVAFGAAQGGLSLEWGDALLLLAVVLLGLGYAEGGRLSTELDGFSVICWALVLALPLTLGSCAVALLAHGLPRPSVQAVLGFAYISIVSMLLGFCAWYRGLALGGVARGSQVQLLQPLLSLAWCSLILAEPLAPATLLTSAAVLTSAVGSRMMR